MALPIGVTLCKHEQAVNLRRSNGGIIHTSVTAASCKHGIRVWASQIWAQATDAGIGLNTARKTSQALWLF